VGIASASDGAENIIFSPASAGKLAKPITPAKEAMQQTVGQYLRDMFRKATFIPQIPPEVKCRILEQTGWGAT
jgi:hypothetical protein